MNEGHVNCDGSRAGYEHRQCGFEGFGMWAFADYDLGIWFLLHDSPIYMNRTS